MVKLIWGLIIEYFLLLSLKFIAYLKPVPPKKWQNLSADKKTIVFLPGWHENWYFFVKIAARLQNYQLFFPKYNSAKPVAENATAIAQQISTHNLSSIVLVGHSKGGLIAKYLIDNFAEINQICRQVIAISSPWQGSWWGNFRLHGLYELIPNSSLLLSLNSNQANIKKMIVIYPKFDNHVLPNKNKLFKGAKNIQLDIIGHTVILQAENAVQQITDIIKHAL